MSYTFRPAKREALHVIVGIAGASGSGKTYSGMTLATGLAGGKRFVVLDTEARRALHYADQFEFDYAEIKSPFSPKTYQDAIEAASAAGYPVIMIDSFSHEHAGEGGILDMQEAELDRLSGGDWRKRDNVKMLSWAKPKQEHKRMMDRLLHVHAHLVICLRAEEKIEMRRIDGRTEVVPKRTASGYSGWIPVCEKTVPYEFTASMVFEPTSPGCPVPIKIQEQHRHIFPPGKPITEETGRQLSAWAAGGEKREKTETAPKRTERGQDSTQRDDPASLLLDLATSKGIGKGLLSDYLDLPRGEKIQDLPVESLRDLYRDVKSGAVTKWIETRKEGAPPESDSFPEDDRGTGDDQLPLGF